ncbi:50S ribosomal protein L24 [Desulfurococcaceae archaeon AG1]|jgi:large subunit ribosomal protein L24|nr:50S ribosomal protein L24 [Desulfurococcaceae archaeon AG1]
MVLTRSSKPGKQRKALAKAPLHARWRFLNAMLSEDLAREHGVKRLPVRAGDTVVILRGDWKGHEGKVVEVDLKRSRVAVEGVTIKKADGTPVYYMIHASKVMITKLGEIDEVRKKIIERRAKKTKEGG